MNNNRRQFLQQIGLAAAGLSLVSATGYAEKDGKKTNKLFFDISLAEFSFAHSLYNGKMDHLDFAPKAKKDFGISTAEYVSGFWKQKPTDMNYLKELKKRADDAGVKSGLIMVDGAGNLGDLNETKRNEALEKHLPWIEAAKYLECHAVRVNLDGEGTDDQVADAAVEGYSRLVEIGAKNNIAVLVENHMGPSVNPDWMVKVLSKVESPFSGALVDTSNFIRYKVESMTLEGFKNAKIIDTFDKYDGVKKLMPFAKGVSAKTHKFDTEGNDTETDFAKILSIVKESGFKGTIGVEYEGAFLKNMIGMEGNYPPEDEGVRITKAILEREGKKLS